MKSLVSNICHPATLQLLRQRRHAKFAKMMLAVQTPRRQLLTIVALVLGCVWVSQAVASVMFRQSADPERLQSWLPLGLFAYSVWHLIKILSRRSVEPFEWTPAEQEMVCAAPISRTQLISYRMASIVNSALMKAFCFTVLMIPDLNIWAAGMLGMFLGLMLVDLIRLGFELFFHGLSSTGQMVSRVVVFSVLAFWIGCGLYGCFNSEDTAMAIASPGSLIFMKNLALLLIDQLSTTAGGILIAPFRVFSAIILTDRLSGISFVNVGLGVGMVVSTGALVYQIDSWCSRRGAEKERLAFDRGMRKKSAEGLSSNVTKQDSVSVPSRLGGFGTLAWRQLLGAYHYRLTLALSLGIPTVLCCFPLLSKHEPFFMLLNLVGGLVFYSFLLLPSALMLDFRRDINRMGVLKSLPVNSLAIAMGQLAAPVLICSMFQGCVLSIAVLVGGVVAWQAILAAVLLLPVNILIFAIENFIFLMSPYRRNQEGVDVLLRTILTFTGKGILFALGLASLLGWAWVTKSVAGTFSLGPILAGALFAIGAWWGMFLVAAGFVFGVVRLFEQFDPSQDGPGES